jgi:hypothetical protein
MIRFFAHFLFILAAWTLTIKFVVPVAFALAEAVPIGTYILWDFWWVLHIWLGWTLLHWRRYTFFLAVAISVAEIVIVVAKFVLFLPAPQWTMWRMNWFINKCFVLACFIGLLTYLLLHAKRLRSPAPARSAAQLA